MIISYRKEPIPMKYPLSNVAKSIYTQDFENYKSNVCHLLHNLGDIDFIQTILEDNTIGQLARNKLTGYALYLVAMLDYVSKENDIPICTNYNWLRKLKLPELAIPVSIRLGMKMFGNDDILKEAYENAIPEFLKYNILEGDVRNVC